jgi:nicotinamide-nucleotide amidase
MTGNKHSAVGPATLLFLWLLIPCAAGWSQPPNTADSAAKSVSQPVRYMIVVTGDELLAGAYADGHTFFLTRTLRPLGLECVGSMCVDDNQADVREALRFAAGKAALVIVTGGLGPTENDITREALRDFTGIALQEHPDALAAMARRFKVPAGELRSNLRRQTEAPTRGTYLKNANGTAIGLVFETADKVIVALPGPPRELQPMVRDELVPYLSRRFGTRPPGSSLTLRFVGLGQSQIDQTLKDHVTLPPDVTTASQFEGGRVDFTFSLPNDTQQDRARLQELKEGILKYLDDYVYADDEATSLEEHIVKLLEARRMTLSLAEVGSGGALVAALHGATGAERVLRGAYLAPSREKLERLLAIPREQPEGSTPGQMAAMVAAATGSAWAVVVGEIQRDERGTSFVEVAFRSPDGRTETRRVRLSGTGESARARLVTELLDQLRRRFRDTGEGTDAQ